MITVRGPRTEYRAGRDVGPFVEATLPLGGDFRQMQHYVDEALDRVFAPYRLRLVTGSSFPRSANRTQLAINAADPLREYDVEVHELHEPSPTGRDHGVKCAVLAITANGRDWVWDRSRGCDEPIVLQSAEHTWSPEQATAFLERFSKHHTFFAPGAADPGMEEYGIGALLRGYGDTWTPEQAIEVYAAKNDLVRLADELREIIAAGHDL